MALTKATYGMISADTSTIDLNIDANTLYVDSSANKVGIGTNSPDVKLDVRGEIAVGYDANYGLRFYNQGRSNWSSIGNFATDTTANLNFKTGGGLTMTMTHAKNVGIGISPSYKLHVSGTGDIVQYIANASPSGSQGRTLLIRDDYASSSQDSKISFAATSSPGQDIYLGKRTTSNLGYFHLTNSSSTEHLTVNMATGNVGIGNTSPLYRLVVSAGGASGLEFGPGYSGTANLIQSYNRSGSAYVHTVYDAAVHRFNISGSEKFKINSSGNVSIGGSFTPSHRLHITGDTNDAARVRVHNSAAGQASLDLDNSEGYFRTFTDAGEYRIYDQTDSAYRLLIDTSGNVGIGTASPSSFNSKGRNLVVNSDGNTGITISANTSSSSTLLFADSYAGTGGTTAYRGSIEYNHATDQMSISTAATEKMRIDSSGNLFIGSEFKRISTDGNGELGIGYGQTATNNIFAVYNNTAAALRVAANGRVGIGTSPGAQLDVNSGGSSDIVKFQNNNGSFIFGKTAGLGSLDMASDANFRIRHGSTLSATFDQNGRLGVGATSPLYKLHVQTSGSDGINIGGSGSFLRFNSGDNQIRVGSGYKMHIDVYDGSSLATILDIDTSGILVSEGQREVKKRVPFFTGGNAGSYSASTNLAYTKSSDNRPTTYDSLKAVVRARAYTKYIHVKTNLLSDNIMFHFRVEGYQYNYGVNKAVRGGYTYSNTVIAEAVEVAYNSNASFTIGDFYRSTTGGTTGFLCMRIDVHQTGYTEGELGIFFGSHSSTVQDSLQITDMQHRDDGNAAY